MNLVTLPQELSVYQVADLKEIDFTQQPLFISVTEEEISVVSATANVPTNTINREDSWRWIYCRINDFLPKRAF